MNSALMNREQQMKPRGISQRPLGIHGIHLARHVFHQSIRAEIDRYDGIWGGLALKKM